VEGRQREWNSGASSLLDALARYLMGAGVGAGLADLSLRDETRRVSLFREQRVATCRDQMCIAR
jgi:hypothetical protein